MTFEKVKAFDGNPDNCLNCAECPHNIGSSDWPGTKLPCGQFLCWVDVTCGEDEP